jgi:hypothetical protein
MWSREGRFGVGGWLVGTGLVYLVPAAQYFGFHIDQRAQAVIFVLSFVALLVGLALMIHALLPNRKKENGMSKSKPPKPPKPNGGNTYIGSQNQIGGNTKQEIHHHYGPPTRTFKGKGIDLGKLSKFAGSQVGLMADGGLDETSGFADEIGRIVQKAGWEVAYSTPAHINYAGAPRGVVELGAVGDFPKQMTALESLLKAAGFPTMRSTEMKVSTAGDCPWVLVWRLAKA